MNIDGTYALSVERLECASLEEFGNIYNTKRIAKIRLVGTELKHSLLVGNDGVRCLCYFKSIGSKLGECSCKNFLTYLEYIFLCSEAHLKVKLIELSRASVCSRILIAEAGSYLEILIKTGNHEQLLVLLRSLRKCIEFSLILSGGNDIVSCTFR